MIKILNFQKNEKVHNRGILIICLILFFWIIIILDSIIISFNYVSKYLFIFFDINLVK